MKSLSVIFISFFILLSSSCSVPPREEKALAKHVVMIGVDAFGGYAYEKAEMPVLKGLASKGAWTHKARVVLPSSSAVNWASILMSSSPTIHGYTEWGSKTPEIPSAVISQYGKFPSIFTQIREQMPDAKTAVVHSWDGIIYFLEDNIITTKIHTEDNEDLTATTVADVIRKEKPVFTFIHFNEPDYVGHNAGHDTPEYYEELKTIDKRIELIVQAVEDAGIQEETIIMIVSDHGGIDKGHGGKTLEEIEVPLIIAGPGIKQNYQLQSTIVDYDYGITVAKILGIQPHQAWRGKVIEEAFID